MQGGLMMIEGSRTPNRAELVTLDEASAASGLAVHSVRWYVKSGRLHSWKEGRRPFRTLILRAELDQLVAELGSVRPRREG